MALFTEYQAIIDFPGCCFYQELLRLYPDEKIILTVRKPERWYASTLNTIYRLRLEWPLSLRHLPQVFSFLNSLIWQGLFSGRFEDRDYALSVYQRHVEEAQKIVPQEQLLVFSVKDGWVPFCEFLEVPVPKDEPFPHKNSGEEFRQMMQDFIRGA